MTESRKAARPSDQDQLAKLTAHIANGEADTLRTPDGKNVAAVLLGRSGGLKGGKARAEKLTPEERRKIARQAAEIRWGKRDG